MLFSNAINVTVRALFSLFLSFCKEVEYMDTRNSRPVYTREEKYSNVQSTQKVRAHNEAIDVTCHTRIGGTDRQNRRYRHTK